MVLAEVADPASASLLDEPVSPAVVELGASVVEAPSESELLEEGDSVAESVGLAVSLPVVVSPEAGLAVEASLLKDD